jgi:chemotaxis methyl-accepting protein methylase
LFKAYDSPGNSLKKTSMHYYTRQRISFLQQYVSSRAEKWYRQDDTIKGVRVNKKISKLFDFRAIPYLTPQFFAKGFEVLPICRSA